MKAVSVEGKDALFEGLECILLWIGCCLGSGRYPFEGKDALFEGGSASSHGLDAAFHEG
ncbi:hypothetical protein [Bartonella grahamii]|uniref:hypothetical protein n=1 Tax=Bartonella grahamii TaxID=33045 RepID=UPI002E7ACBB6|nr:hypothetical protein [Bartonella grahamii]